MKRDIYDLQFSPEKPGRTNLLNFKQDGKICNLPLYAVSLLKRITGGTETVIRE